MLLEGSFNHQINGIADKLLPLNEPLIAGCAEDDYSQQSD
jgi:hypothetical protein